MLLQCILVYLARFKCDCNLATFAALAPVFTVGTVTIFSLGLNFATYTVTCPLLLGVYKPLVAPRVHKRGKESVALHNSYVATLFSKYKVQPCNVM